MFNPYLELAKFVAMMTGEDLIPLLDDFGGVNWSDVSHYEFCKETKGDVQ